MITSVACIVSDVAVADRVCALTTAAFRRWSAVRLPVQLKFFEAIDEEDLRPKKLLGAQLESARDGSHGHSDGIVHGQYVGYFDRDCVSQVENMKQTETGVDFRAFSPCRTVLRKEYPWAHLWKGQSSGVDHTTELRIPNSLTDVHLIASDEIQALY